MKQKLKIGDILYRSKGLVVKHAGAYFDDDLVIHNSPDGDVQISSTDQFSEGKSIQVVASELSVLQAKQFQLRAKEKLGQPKSYNVLSSNCEQLVSEILTGTASSPQVKGAVLGGVTAAILAKSINSKHILWLSLAGIVAGCVAVNAQRNYDYVI